MQYWAIVPPNPQPQPRYCPSLDSTHFWGCPHITSAIRHCDHDDHLVEEEGKMCSLNGVGKGVHHCHRSSLPSSSSSSPSPPPSPGWRRGQSVQSQRRGEGRRRSSQSVGISHQAQGSLSEDFSVIIYYHCLIKYPKFICNIKYPHVTLSQSVKIQTNWSVGHL